MSGGKQVAHIDGESRGKKRLRKTSSSSEEDRSEILKHLLETTSEIKKTLNSSSVASLTKKQLNSTIEEGIKTAVERALCEITKLFDNKFHDFEVRVAEKLTTWTQSETEFKSPGCKELHVNNRSEPRHNNNIELRGLPGKGKESIATFLTSENGASVHHCVPTENCDSSRSLADTKQKSLVIQEDVNQANSQEDPLIDATTVSGAVWGGTGAKKGSAVHIKAEAPEQESTHLKEVSALEFEYIVTEDSEENNVDLQEENTGIHPIIHEEGRSWRINQDRERITSITNIPSTARTSHWLQDKETMFYSDSGESESFSGSDEDCAQEDGLESSSTEAYTDSGTEDEEPCGTGKSGQPAKKLSWKKELPGQTRPLSPFHFNRTPGMTCEVADKNSPLSYFSLFFTDDLMAMILQQTNKYAAENPPAVSTAEFQDITVNELWCFLGLFIVIGIIPKPSIGDYWTTEFFTQTPAFHHIMPRKRFTDIAKNLHFVDNHDPAAREAGKLWKVCPLLEYIGQRFKEVYIPQRNICIDEAIMLYRGRLALKAFKYKSQFGIKSYTVCESGTGKSGYIWNYKMYSGKDTAGGALKSQKIVTNLLHGLENSGYTLWMDDSHCSPDLFFELQRMGVDACGTVLPNKKNMPLDCKHQKLHKGQGESWVSDAEPKLHVVRWQGKKEIFMLTTIHDLSVQQTQRTNWRTGERLVKPKCMLDFNKNIRSGDGRNQILKTYAMINKNRKWYIKLFFHVLDMTITNSYVLFMKNGGDLTDYNFRVKLASEIIKRWKEVTISTRFSHSDPPTRLEAADAHYLVQIPPTAKKQKSYRVCRVCSAKVRFAAKISGQKIKRGDRAGARETRYMCVKCTVPLCVLPCHQIYHTQKIYDNPCSV